MNHCIFCAIAGGTKNTTFLYEDANVVAFKDIHPQAPTHVLVIPKQHFESIKDVQDEGLIGHLFTVAKQVAQDLGIKDYRLVINTGREAGQSVFHLHLHLLGGRFLAWPPG